MRQALSIGDRVKAILTRGRSLADDIHPQGIFYVEHTRNGALINTFSIKNAVTNVAKNDLLNVYFNSTTASGYWSIGLIDASTFSSTSVSDTSASHSGWNEYTNYTVGSSDSTHRGTWGQGSPAGQLITNGSPVTFTMTTSSGSIWGIFVIAGNTKGGNTGILWSTVAFNSALSVNSGDVLNVTYSIQL